MPPKNAPHPPAVSRKSSCLRGIPPKTSLTPNPQSPPLPANTDMGNAAVVAFAAKSNRGTSDSEDEESIESSPLACSNDNFDDEDNRKLPARHDPRQDSDSVNEADRKLPARRNPPRHSSRRVLFNESSDEKSNTRATWTFC